LPITVSVPAPAAAVQVSTGAVGGTATVDVAVTWSKPFPDTDYTVVASVEIDESGDSLTVRRVRSKTTTGCVVNVANAALTTKTGMVHAMAWAG
jgi:acyl-coenzyme A thioesterase PaaI-like protein